GAGASFIREWKIRGYKKELKAENSGQVNLEDLNYQTSALELGFDTPDYVYLRDARGVLQATPGGMKWTYEDQNIRMERSFSYAPDRPHVDVGIEVVFKAKPAAHAFVSLVSTSKEGDPAEQDRQLLYWTDNEIKRFPVTSDVAIEASSGAARWIGVASRYFVLALLPDPASGAKAVIQPNGSRSGRVSLSVPVTGNHLKFAMKAFFGPKDLNLLRSVDPTLDHTVDFGIFTVIAYPILQAIKWIYQTAANYGVAIILITLLLKIVTFPLTYKSMKSMKEMAKIQPQLQKVREKYANDREALNREMLTLMRSHGYNPMAGCWPVLIQMPIFIALYSVLYGAVELYQAPFAFWIKDLSSQDPFYVTPVLLTITMYFQQKMTPNTATDPMQAKMIQFMPLIFGAMMINLPSGLTLYMLVNALATIVQQFFLNRKLGMPGRGVVVANAR
ncbi:MAG: membrane protein insertase YidC, partial [Bdellovibrionota bacterium]